VREKTDWEFGFDDWMNEKITVEEANELLAEGKISQEYRNGVVAADWDDAQ
jgi:hypothetical protein